MTRNDDTSIVYRDLLTLLITSMAVLLSITLMQASAAKAKAQLGEAPAIGNVVIEARWPDGIDVDLDLWVRGPGDTRPVGYSNRGGEFFSLVRDDLGMRGDRTPKNYEDAASRGIEPGRYVANLHAYGGDDTRYPVKAKLRAVIWNNSKLVRLVEHEVVLEAPGQEVTGFQFELDERGALVPGSVSFDYLPLRAEQPGETPSEEQ